MHVRNQIRHARPVQLLKNLFQNSENISMSKKENIEKDKKTVFAKDIVQNNPIFTVPEIQGFFHLFNLYADERRQANVSDILGTARTLGFEKKHPLVFRAFVDIATAYDGQWIRFEAFLTDLTHKLGHPQDQEGRRAMFELADVDGKQKLTIGDLLKISDSLDFGLNFEQVQQIVRNIAGPNEKAISWDQFNEHVAKKKLEKRTD